MNLILLLSSIPIIITLILIGVIAYKGATIRRMYVHELREHIEDYGSSNDEETIAWYNKHRLGDIERRAIKAVAIKANTSYSRVHNLVRKPKDPYISLTYKPVKDEISKLER